MGWHSVQNEFDSNSYDGFLKGMEKIFRRLTNNIDYLLKHDGYSFEIGANLYGVEGLKST